MSLRPSAPVEARIIVVCGQVLQASGRSAAHAAVQLGFSRATCDEAGCYALEVNPDLVTPESALIAAGPAELAAIFGFGKTVQSWRADTLVQDLIMQACPWRIAGVVVDEQERPIPSVQIAMVEREGQLAALPWLEVVTDATGRFQFDGLPPGSGRLQLVDPASLAVTTTGEVRAGQSDLHLVLRREELGPVTLIVRTRAGVPVAGATVEVGCGQPTLSRAVGQTDAAGRVKLPPLAGDASVRIVDDVADHSFLAKQVALADCPPGTPATITVSEACRIHLMASETRRSARGLRVLDRDGRALLFVSHGAMKIVVPRLVIGPASDAPFLLDIPEEAHSLVLYDQADSEIRRVTLRPSPSVTSVIEP